MPLLRCLIAILCLCAGCFAAELTGTATSKSGQPVSGVYVYSPVGTPYNHETNTDSRGKFKLPDHSRVVFFRHPDFRPLSKVVDSAATNLDVVLEESAGSELKVASCPVGGAPSTRIGFELKFLVPEGMVVKKVGDADYTEYYLFYQGNERETLKVSRWRYLELYPPEKLLLSATQFKERWWVSTEFGKGEADVWGISKDGKRWRWTSLLQGSASYEGVSADAAKTFDKIIDGMCLDAELLTPAGRNRRYTAPNNGMHPTPSQHESHES